MSVITAAPLIPAASRIPEARLCEAPLWGQPGRANPAKASTLPPIAKRRPARSARARPDRWRDRVQIVVWDGLFNLTRALPVWGPILFWGLVAWLAGLVLGFTWTAALP